MARFIFYRLIQAALVMGLAALIAFVLFRYVGDPINGMVGEETNLADRAALRERLGLNDSTPVQLGRFIVHALRGDFGISYQLQRPVAVLLKERLPATLELVG